MQFVVSQKIGFRCYSNCEVNNFCVHFDTCTEHVLIQMRFCHGFISSMKEKHGLYSAVKPRTT